MEELAMFLKEKPLSFKVVLVFFLAGLVLAGRSLYVRGTEQQDEPELIQPVRVHKPEHVRGVHLSAWVAGSGKLRERVWDLFNATEINTPVIAGHA